MWRALQIGCGWLSLAVATATLAQGFDGNGPLPVRNFQPIQLIFLNLPFERARAVAPGSFELHLESAESNEIATNHGDIQAVLKFETNRTVLGGTVGVTPGFDVGLDVPVVSRFGGFMDPVIDSLEDFFGTSNVERKQFPNNSFGGFNVRRGNVTLFDGKDQSFELGDIWGSAKYEVWHADGWPLVSIRGAIKAPTGRAGSVFGSGKPDFGLGVAAEHRLLEWLWAYGNFNVIYPVGPIASGQLTLNPFVTEGLAAEAHVIGNLSLLLQQETYTNPIHGTGTRLLDGTVAELTGGLNLTWERLLLQFAAIDNLTPVVSAADVTLLLRLTYRG